ncbi:MAG: HD domain-containing protein [Myxococcota bacterium]
MQAGADRKHNVVHLAHRRFLRGRILDEISDLLSHPKFLETHEQVHHSVRKSEHLIRSARFAYWIARAVGANPRVCARAGLLHDLHSRLGTWSTHGAIAAAVADEIGEEPEVCRAIVPHMFPLGPAPRTREGWVLAIADKLATMADTADFLLHMVDGRSLRERRMLLATDRFVCRSKQRAVVKRAA